MKKIQSEDDVSLQKVDLNLFRVFEAVMKNRTVASAGRELGVTASAVSHALSRLRKVVGDELFVMGPTGMEPTPRALELAPSISEGIGRIQSALQTKPFNPATSVRNFTIAASDYPGSVVIPPLIALLSRTAPQIAFRIFPIGRLDVVRNLDSGHVDLVLGWFGDLPDRLRRRVIVTEHEALIVRAGHPLTEGMLTRQRLFDYPHVVVELSGSEQQGSDGFLDDRGLVRRIWIERLLIDATGQDEALLGRVPVTVPTFAPVPAIVQRTDMIATLPRRLALQAARDGSVVVLDLPYEPLEVQVEAVHHQRSDGDAGLRWLIEQMTAVMRDKEGQDSLRASAKEPDAGA
jgi:DNA-binding transcriptional LysR family regulator